MANINHTVNHTVQVQQSECGDPLSSDFRGPPTWEMTLIFTINQLVGAIAAAQVEDFTFDAQERLNRFGRRAALNTPEVYYQQMRGAERIAGSFF